VGYFASVFFGTFVLEDAALATSLKLVADGKLSFGAAFLAVFAGISIGDLGLYFLGALARRFKFLRFSRSRNLQNGSALLASSIVISRAVPGTRLPLYTSAGYFRYPFWSFLFLTIVTVFAWVAFTLLAARTFGDLFLHHWVLAVFVFLLTMGLLRRLVLTLSDRWERKAALHRWRRWLHFEFWPANRNGTSFSILTPKPQPPCRRLKSPATPILMEREPPSTRPAFLFHSL
jgi:membrane protein DedA with SNARE-associated domain